jgi:pimeloyl-ACP methyl ester carboxylesterase
MAIEQGAAAAFMVVVSGGAEDSIDQGMYQVGQALVCGGAPPELGARAKDIGSRARKATSYEEYVAAVEEALQIPGVEAVYPVQIVPQDEWAPLPRELESFFDPMDVVERVDIPILAVFGELDRYIDPIQGAEAYAAAFDRAGNEHGRVELLGGVGHTMLEQVSGCPGEPGGATSRDYLELLEEFIVDVSPAG